MTAQLDMLRRLPRDTATYDGANDEYRYTLTRHWGPGEMVTWVMLNPSTATAEVNDPTVRRCIGFSQDWGFGALTVVNAYALRSTDPAGLWRVTDPVGPGNDEAIRMAANRAIRVVVAWGANITATRELRLARLLRDHAPVHLGLTKDGHPRHPLYVRGDVTPEPWLPRRPKGAA